MLAPRNTLWSVQPEVLTRALQLLALQPTDSFLDLGCGNGTTVTEANKIFNCKAVGVEIHAGRAREAADYVAHQCPSGGAEIVCGNALEADMSGATAIYVYLIERGLKAVAHTIEAQAEAMPETSRLKWMKDLRLVSVLYKIPLLNWVPVHVEWVEFTRYSQNASIKNDKADKSGSGMKLKTPVYLYRPAEAFKRAQGATPTARVDAAVHQAAATAHAEAGEAACGGGGSKGDVTLGPAAAPATSSLGKQVQVHHIGSAAGIST